MSQNFLLPIDPTLKATKINTVQSLSHLIRNEKVGCSIHLSGTNIDKGSLLSK